MKTVVLQSFRTTDVPAWMQRCMASVRTWARLCDYDYEFMDDRIFDLCGADYLAQVGGNKRAITNLARLELIRLRLAETYDRAMWLDADTFIFAPAEFRMDIRTGYAFGREVWVERHQTGCTFVEYGVHNATCVFTRAQSDLDFLIHTARYIAATRQIRESFAVGVWLITGLQRSLRFPLLQDSGMFSPDIINALATGDDALIAILAEAHGHPLHAANLGWSLMGANTQRISAPEDVIKTAMDRLEWNAGAVINSFLPARSGAKATGPTTITTTPRKREEISSHLNSPSWLLARALRVIASRNMPRTVARSLHRAANALGRR